MGRPQGELPSGNGNPRALARPVERRGVEPRSCRAKAVFSQLNYHPEPAVLASDLHHRTFISFSPHILYLLVRWAIIHRSHWVHHALFFAAGREGIEAFSQEFWRLRRLHNATPQGAPEGGSNSPHLIDNQAASPDAYEGKPAPPTGFEPASSRLTGNRPPSARIRASRWRAECQVLYQAELRRQGSGSRTVVLRPGSGEGRATERIPAPPAGLEPASTGFVGRPLSIRARGLLLRAGRWSRTTKTVPLRPRRSRARVKDRCHPSWRRPAKEGA